MSKSRQKIGRRETRGEDRSERNARVVEVFERQAQQQPAGFFGELLYMIKNNKKWWLVPILLTLLALSALVFLGGTAAAPFIYTLF